jgi:hypothetical protein
VPTKMDKEIKQKLDDLTDSQKIVVLNYLLAELDKPDPEIDKEWAKVKALSYSEVFSKYKK